MHVVAFNLVDNSWLGGINYLNNTFGVIRSRLSGRVEARLVVDPTIDPHHVERLAARLRVAPVMSETVRGMGRGLGLCRTLLLGRDERFDALIRSLDADLVFETGAYFGWRCGLPVLSWIPDFQHRHLPHHFARYNWYRRETSFRVIAAGGRSIMLSSMDARRDLETFYPPVKRSCVVVPFAADIDPARPLAQASAMREKYGLPTRYIYSPNQFWTHKNHIFIVRTLIEMKARGDIGALPPIVFTGSGKDPRRPDHYDALMRMVAEAGIEPWFHHLGVVPYEDVLALSAGADALLNASLFEGWSTAVEEAKALGTPLLLSDLRVHREQAPHAAFFDPQRTSELADVLLTSALSRRAERPDISALRRDQDARQDLHAERLWTAIDSAVAEGRAAAT